MGGSKVSAVILLFVGLVQLGVGGLFLFLASTTPILRGGFIPASIVLFVVGLGLIAGGVSWWRKAVRAQQIRSSGVSGQAQILGLRQTSLSVNGQPQVELRLMVTTPVHGSFEVTRKEIVPLIMVGRLTNGRPLPVKVDPTNPNDLVIDWESSL